MTEWTPPGAGTGGPNFSPPSFRGISVGNCCAPVEILTAAGDSIASIASGGSYTAPYYRLDATLLANGSNQVSAVVLTDSQFNEITENRVNVNSIVFKKNNVVQTLPFNAVENDTITITVTPTNGAANAQFSMVGTFLGSSQTVQAPYLGSTGRYVYFLSEVSRQVDIIDSTTDLIVSTIALDATSLHTAIRYRSVNNSVYIWGFSGINTFTEQIINCTTQALGAMNSYAALNSGITNICAAYDYSHDRFILCGGGGATAPIILFDPNTSTYTTTPLFDMPNFVTSVDYMGFSGLLEDAFFICGGTSSSSIALKDEGSDFIVKEAIMRTGVAQVCYNRNNGTYVVSESGGGPRTYSPRIKPELSYISQTNFRRAGIAHDFNSDTMIGCDIVTRSYAIYNIGAGTVNGFTLAAVGAETAYRSALYNEFSDKFYINSASGSVGRAINTVTGAVIATFVLGNQKVGNGGSFNQICQDRLALY